MSENRMQEISLTKWDLEKAILRWWFMSHLAYNYQRMQAGGFASMMGPLLKKLYPDNPEAVAEGLKRHMMFFNTEPRWGSVIHGIVIALEEQKAKGNDIDEETIVDLKSSLMGPLAGIGNSIAQFGLAPLFSTIFAGLAMNGLTFAPMAFWITMIISMLTINYK